MKKQDILTDIIIEDLTLDSIEEYFKNVMMKSKPKRHFSPVGKDLLKKYNRAFRQFQHDFKGDN